MKSIFEWHALQDGFVRLLGEMRFSVRPVFLRSTRTSNIDFTSAPKIRSFSGYCLIYP
jgi:hypothetical protein